MKTTLLLAVAALMTVGVAGAAPSRAPVFQIRLIEDNTATNAESMTVTRPGKVRGTTEPEEVQVQKAAPFDHMSIQSATVERNAQTGAPEIVFTMTPEGKKRFAQFTRDNVGKRIAIIVDGKVQSTPKIMREIYNGKGVITGTFTMSEAKDLAARINSAGR